MRNPLEDSVQTLLFDTTLEIGESVATLPIAGEDALAHSG
jgi:hypothetical protein